MRVKRRKINSDSRLDSWCVKVSIPRRIYTAKCSGGSPQQDQKLGPKLLQLLLPQPIDYIIVRLAGMVMSVGTGGRGTPGNGS